jgi:deoxyribose-phosphate aldolase
MKLTRTDIARMIDLSVVSAQAGEADIRALAETVKKHRCIIATTLPCHTPLILKLLADEPDIGVSGNVGFPSGGQSSAIKVLETKELINLGCDEIDMVMNGGMHKSGRCQYVKDDIRGVVEAAGEAPVKVILECHYLLDDEIRRACEICVETGAAFVKTGTGWAPTGATLENISLIKSCVGDDIAIKASGGIRGLETLVEMYRRGARRFGIGLGWGRQLFEELDAVPGGTAEV